MVAHVTVGTVHPFLLTLLVELWNHGEDPLDILLGILLRHLSRLRNWTRIVI